MRFEVRKFEVEVEVTYDFIVRRTRAVISFESGESQVVLLNIYFKPF